MLRADKRKAFSLYIMLLRAPPALPTCTIHDAVLRPSNRQRTELAVDTAYKAAAWSLP